MLRYVVILISIVFSTAAMAEGLSYNYVQGAYQRVEIDFPGGDVDGDGFGIGGSFEINDMWHAFASYSTSDLDFGVDFDQLAFGAGFSSGLNDNVDLVARLAYVQVDASVSGFGSADDDGFGISVGLRGMVAERVELEGYVDYVDLDDSGDDTSFNGAAWYKVSDNFNAGLQVGFGDDVTSWGIAGRLFFD